MLAPAKFIDLYSQTGSVKTQKPLGQLFTLGILAGFLIGLGASVTNIACFGIDNPSIAKVVSGLLFPFGLILVIYTGAELFTGNCLIPISILEQKTTFGKMLRNWVTVYFGNFAGGVALAAACAFMGQFAMGDNGLALYTMQVANTKCSLTFGKAFVFGILCNILVCIAVACATCATSAIGKAVGAYLPIAFFVINGFEHCVANMYYIPAGLFAKSIYPSLGAGFGALTWGSFLLHNLLPVTLGNIVGGCGLAILWWYAHRTRAASLTTAP